MLRIVMDGAGDVPEGWLAEYDIQVIPINIHFGERMFLQGIDLSNADFYHMAQESRVIPQTSQPSPQQFIDFYRQIASPGDTILSLHVTSKLSGTFASAQAAARELDGQYRVIPFDSASGSAAMGYMCQEARVMDRRGMDVADIYRRLGYISRQVTIFLTLNTLDFARKSGRVSSLQAALASVLNVKPIIALQDGMLEMAGRVRTRHKSLEHILDATVQAMGDRLVNAAVVHAEDKESGLLLMDKVRAALNCKSLIMTDLSISVAANLGPGTVGIIAYPVEEE